ncbi:lysophospholipid acyltransferase family protein [Azospirillum rugosum]|uniref:1-acyl-sn-glycerol-3-phosphate acyltransferase n=1 Tax=Azospirillum rugosum TaxID=416170 RepID=A0ABS4SHK1_9PROT|nr:lysophospholipid acyltransferase family protein [Azospirillum rugosum]MBP2292053.1 1-acyl-sn-glycerol-3-phosphate acyltransferase [Azospirillum rugosum]MDQ0525811.1 1-acyl-sn-glycerol-3-phosphate acyltransferase [Azospirillum rugosum]
MVERLDRLWRLAGTGFAFAFLFGGGAVLALTAFPLVHAVTPPGPRRRERNQWLIHWAFRFYLWILVSLRVIAVEVVAAERLRDGGSGMKGEMIIANHPSLLDVVLLMALVPRAQCIVKKELWASPYLGNLVRGTGYIRNDLEPEALLDACRQALEAGNRLIIFPEGTRTVPGEPMRLRRGFANIATLLGAELQLVTITCSPATLIKGEPWWAIPSRRPRFRVEVGDRIDAKAWLGTQHRSLAARKLVRFIEQYYAERLAHG